MNRRNFIRSGGALGVLGFMPFSSFPASPPPNFKLGYQLFSIRDEMAKDPVATLKALKAMGYEDFEHYGFDAEDGTYYGYKAAEFKTIMDDLGLGISSGHYPFADYFGSPQEELLGYLDRCIEGALTMESDYIVWPWLAPEHRNVEGYKQLVRKLNAMAERVSDAGLGFAYHNHGYEFEDHQGVTGYDIITKETDSDLVKLQLDMYWIMHEAKTIPAKVIEAHPGRFVMWHIKDMHKVSRDYTELGNGSIDYHKVLPEPSLSGLEYFYIEQGGNFTESSMKSAAFSADYFKKHLRQYL